MNKEIETLTKWQDPTIEMLNKKIEAQDKIINTQALEIARLNKKYENAVADYEEEKYKNTKAIEYIKIATDGITEYLDIKEIKELLEILGDKENE